MLKLLTDPRFAGLKGDELTAALLKHFPALAAAERAELRAELGAEIARRLVRATNELEVIAALAAKFLSNTRPERTLQ